MNILNSTVRAVARRPSIITIPAVLGFFFYLFNAYNPVTSFITGIVSITGSTVLDSLVSAIQMLIDPAFLPTILVLFVLVTIIGALAAGLILSGYFNIVSAASEGRAKRRGEFAEGLKRYFSKYFLITGRVLPFFMLMAVFMLISALPAIIVTRATMNGKPELLLAAVFVDILTVAVLFFTLLFSCAYMLFWYPSAMKAAKKSFAFAKRTVDRNFWGIISRIFVFVTVFLLVHYAIFSVDGYFLRHLLGWLFDTAFFTTLAVYVFGASGSVINHPAEGE